MTSDAIRFYLGYIPQIWKFFTSWSIPGTDFTPAALCFFVLSVGLVIRTFKRLTSVPDASFGSSNSRSKSSEG
jgi:hypothetical protein|nr:MAG TPA: hypothetical protein [Inoviridae sp.]